MVNKEFEVLLKVAEKPNVNGIIFPLEELEKIREQINDRENVFGLVVKSEVEKYPSDLNIERVTHSISKAYIKDDSLYATINFLDTPEDNSCLPYEGLICNIAFVGTGKVDEKKVVSDYELHRIDLLDKSKKLPWDIREWHPDDEGYG